ncbi:MAG TPA: glycosyltransferase [Xenococcaceae cyanobacterium]
MDSDRNLAAKNPDPGEFHYLQGKNFAQQQQWTAAQAAYQQAIDLGYSTWEVYQEWGDILVQLEVWDEAIGAYQQAIKLNDRAITAYLNLGKVLLKLELFAEAETFFRQAIQLKPDVTVAYEYLGEALAPQEKWDEAIAIYQTALQLQPSLASIAVKLAAALSARAKLDLTAAVDYYLQVVATAEDREAVYLKISQILAQQGNLDQAFVYASYGVDFQAKEPDYTAFLTEITYQRSQLYPAIPEFRIPDANYALWRKYHTRTTADLRQICLIVAQLNSKPLISILLPLEAWDNLEATIISLQRQVYPFWELLIVWQEATSASLLLASRQKQLAKIVREYSNGDRRIKWQTAAATDLGHLANQALAMAQGEYLTLLQAETILTPDALWELILALEQQDNPDIIYGDEDRLAADNSLTQPWLKPDWCPDLLLSRNYFGAVVWCRRDLVESVGGFSSDYHQGYIYDLLLRLTETTTNIRHITAIIAHRSDKIAPEASTKVITAALERRGEPGKVIDNAKFPEIKTIRYKIREQALVSIIIPTRNQGKILDRCLASIFNLSTYHHYEVILVDNGSNEPEALATIASWEKQYPNQLRTIKLDIAFNYSQLNNAAVSQASGKYLLFLNDDTVVISPDWLEAMIEQAQRNSIGAVGTLLFYPDERIQHAGVILGVTGIAGHSYRNLSVSNVAGRLTTTNYSAVTAACLMCRHEVFTAVGGFNSNLAVAYNDVDFCLKLKQQGYNNIFLPHVKLYHYESQTRQQDDTPEKQQRIQQEIAYMAKTWGQIIRQDPCYNIHLSKQKEDHSLNLNPQLEVISVVLAAVSEAELWGFFIDQPQIGCLKTNSLDIIGWVVGRIADAIALEVIGNGKVLNSTAINQFRDDVAQVYPHIPTSKNSGFHLTLSSNLLPLNGYLILQAKLANTMTIVLGTIQLQCR